jgi:hypothetical protein
MLANRYEIATPQQPLVDTASVNECAIRAVQVGQNTAVGCFFYLRMMSTDEFAFNLNITVRAAADRG